MKAKFQAFQQRQVMQCDTFEIFSYNEPRTHAVPVHDHDFYEMYFCRTGTIQFMVESRTYSLAPGDIVLVNPNELHRAIVDSETHDERIVLWIDRRFLQGIHEPGENLCQCFESGKGFLRLSPIEKTRFEKLAIELVDEYYGVEYCSHLASLALFVRLMVELNRISAEKNDSITDAVFCKPVVTGVLSYIGEHYSENISLDTLAAEFFVSKYHLSHEFSDSVGISVHKYIVLKRLAAARQLIIDGMSPCDACHECGYRDYSNFYRAFYALYGTNPTSIT